MDPLASWGTACTILDPVPDPRIQLNLATFANKQGVLKRLYILSFPAMKFKIRDRREFRVLNGTALARPTFAS